MSMPRSATSQERGGEAKKKEEIFTYNAPWDIYGMNWSVRPDRRFRLAIGSFIEEYSNKVQVLTPSQDPQTLPPNSAFSRTPNLAGESVRSPQQPQTTVDSEGGEIWAPPSSPALPQGRRVAELRWQGSVQHFHLGSVSCILADPHLCVGLPPAAFTFLPLRGQRIVVGGSKQASLTSPDGPC